MARGERRACPACGTWRCSECGASRRLANRFPLLPHACPGNPEHTVGIMLPVFHISRGKAEDHVDAIEDLVQDRQPMYPLQGYDYTAGSSKDS